jgi:HTH-type transcriptional regulator/antitoxin HipB
MVQKLNAKKLIISRIDNHAQDIRLSTFEKFAAVLGRKLEVSVL